MTAYQTEWARNNKDKVSASAKKYYRTQQGQWMSMCKHLRRKYGISGEEYAWLENEQDRSCYLCGCPSEETRDGRLVVDHCHSSGAVRRLLCHKCNAGLGQFNDDPELMRRAASYIEEFNHE